ncbi:hypothetical protein L6452_06411 [Arctium lappa]|uniref:Uncharacterized protein n=1 Tax=Arctium lappa TaxID=4217 RepID=A0ACB9EIT6_ARCLA|nr:hypothetical protein L6452_06411 [Arctium lappa]
MVLTSKTSPSHGIRTEIVQWDSSKTPQNMHVDAIGVKSKRGIQVIVAASPPTDDAVIATEPLTKEDLVGYLASGCKPKENWRFDF